MGIIVGLRTIFVNIGTHCSLLPNGDLSIQEGEM